MPLSYFEGRNNLKHYFNHRENLALIAEIAPEGPIGILGLGTGTVSRIIHAFWPERKMTGWELDGIVLDAGRMHMGLKELEDAGCLTCHRGDALVPEASIEGGFAGIIVDIFAKGDVIDALKKAEAWESISQKLRPGGRCVANLGNSKEPLTLLGDTFADQGLYIKSTQQNLLGVTGEDPAVVIPQLPAELQHIAKGWSRWQG